MVDPLPDHILPKLGMGFYTNRYVAVAMGIHLIKQWENEGNPEKMVDVWDLITADAAIALARAKSFALFQGNGTKEPEGLDFFIEAAAPATHSAVMGGIDKSANAFWRNKFEQLTTNFGVIGAGTSIPAGMLAIMNLIKATTVGSKRPSDLVTFQDCYENIRRAFIETSSPLHMITEKLDGVNYGVQSFLFDGHRIGWDSQCRTDRMYALHLENQYRMDYAPSENSAYAGKVDGDIEFAEAAERIMDLDGNLFLIENPNVVQRVHESAQAYRFMQNMKWVFDSMNVGITRLSQFGVLASSSGSGLGTW